MPPQTYTAAQMRAIDKYTVEHVGIDVKQLMEVAGLRSAESAMKLLGKGKTKRVVVLSGPGGNGGDGLVCAKWLLFWGCDVTLVSSHPVDRLRDLTALQLNVWKAIGGKISVYPPESKDVDLIIDSLFGTSLAGNPTGRSAELIEWSNGSGKPVLSLDVPSGLDATTGKAYSPCIKATHTVEYGLLKSGVGAKDAKPYVGGVEVIDIGFPRVIPPTVLTSAA